VQLHEIPTNTVKARCYSCGTYLAFHPDDTDLIPQAFADHAKLCHGPPPDLFSQTLTCANGGNVHCPCSAEDGVCCWCGTDTYPTP
jgi:hypothetical protein